jgi:vancomycin permeability regulator SanA
MFKKILKLILISIIILIIFIFCVNFYIISFQKYTYEKIDNLPSAEAVMVLGAKVYNNGNLSDILKDRAQTALEVYESGKAQKILVSGDHSRKDYDEVNAVKKYLLENGVKPEDIFLDHAGFDTYDSLYRAKHIFKINSIIVSTQKFHLPRAVYIGKSLDLETYGIVADKHIYRSALTNNLREILSRTKAFFNVNFDAKPKFLGKEIPISGDGRESWD